MTAPMTTPLGAPPVPLLVGHHVYAGGTLPPMLAALYEYWLAGNGLFIHAEREGLSVCIPVSHQEVRGLPRLDPSVQLTYPRVPGGAIEMMLQTSKDVAYRRPTEALFHLWMESGLWRLLFPPQQAGATHVTPTDTGDGTSYAKAILEVHSHHSMRAFFSETDNRDEQGFRLYGVVGDIWTKPTVRLRVGVYGHFYPVPLDRVFSDVPAYVRDGWRDR